MYSDGDVARNLLSRGAEVDESGTQYGRNSRTLGFW